jgi:hypothetical protein
VKITFAGCQNAAAEMEFFVTDRASGKFTPNFGNAQGLQIVTMTVEDKDGGTVTLTYYYMVEASKFLKTYSTGPSGGTTTSALSQRYVRMRNRGGLGAGHTFVSGGATFSSAENYELTWNCGKSVYVPAYAFGYKVANPVDNGTLDGMDIAIDATGRQNKDMTYTDYYNYSTRDGSDGRDSFFYLWILTTLDESGTPNDVILGNGAAPEQKGPPGLGRIPLPTNQNEDGSYLDTIIEAIFAKEWREEDNLGDINQDGIPDAFAWTVWGNGQTLIEATAGVESLAGDLNDLSAGNPDEDFIPGVWQAQRPALSLMAHCSDTITGSRPYTIISVLTGFARSRICAMRSSKEAVTESSPASRSTSRVKELNAFSPKSPRTSIPADRA